MKLSIIIALFFIIHNTFAQKPDDIVGKYHLPNDLDVKIFKYKNKYYGKIIALNGFENGQTKDINNDNKNLRKKSLIGMLIIKGLEYDSEEKKWINGKMYGPEKGMTFNLKVTEIRKNEIEVVGSKYLFWHTLTWKKI